MINNMHVTITDTIQAQISYTGSVKILYMDRRDGKTKIIKEHNTGDLGLFTAITRCLAGMPADEYLPSYIMGYYEGGLDQEAFTQHIGFASKPVLFLDDKIGDGSSNNIVQYTFMVPINNLIERGPKIDRLVMYNKQGQVCATLNLVDNKIETNVASNILIYWKLKFASASL